jgi:PBP1b-binding outer membrane lipoprotein LpoB
MKKTLLTAAISAFLFAGCAGNKTDENSHDGTQEHGEGTHEHHEGADHQHSDTVKQQEFTVDTAKTEKAHDHPHEHDGHDHKH